MKPYAKNILLSLPVLFAAAAFTSCDVDKVEDGNIPDVKVEVDGEAKVPEYDVDGPDVKIGKKEVEVPTVEIEMPKDEVNEDD